MGQPSNPFTQKFGSSIDSVNRTKANGSLRGVKGTLQKQLSSKFLEKGKQRSSTQQNLYQMYLWGDGEHRR